MTADNYQRADSVAFANKVSKKIAGWYSNDTYHDRAVNRIVLLREEIYSLIEKVEKVSTKKLLKYLDSSGFFYRPSSATRHHNFPGGLAEHSLCVFKIVEDWNNMTPQERKESELYNFKFSKRKDKIHCDIFTEKMDFDDMVLAAICHDLCKAKHYYLDGRIIRSHNSDPEPRNVHASLSVKRLKENGITSPIAEEIRLAVLTHMSLYPKTEPTHLSTAQIAGRKSILAITIWGADKLDASRHPAGKQRHRDL